MAKARSAVRRARRAPAAAATSTANYSIPFDYAARFDLQGVPGRVVEAVIATDTDGAFVANTIGYGFEPERGRPLTIRRQQRAFSLADVRLAELPADALLSGFRIHPDAIGEVFPGTSTDDDDAIGPVYRWDPAVQLSRTELGTTLQRLDPSSDVSFMFSMIDSVTGRELQDEPSFSVAALGAADGRRPFRKLARPMTFQPRSTVRLQVIELNENVRGALFIVLHGYKQLHLPTQSPELAATVRTLQNLQQGTVPEGRIIPFDYVATVELHGQPLRRPTIEIPVNTEGGFVATSIGYGLDVPERDVEISLPNANSVDLAQLRLSAFPPDALVDGIRIRPQLIRMAFRDNGALANALDPTFVQSLFERLNRPEDVSFRYEIEDTGSGRDLQNRPINNRAGWGSADGKRPFRSLNPPLVLMPRSTLQLQIQERFGRGRLFVVFHGFKVLGRM